MRPSYRLHYAYCPSVCPSVRPSVCPVRARNSKTKKRRKIQIVIDVPTARVSEMQVFSSKGPRSRSQDLSGCKHLQNLASSLLTGGSAGGSRATHQTYAIVRPTLVSAPAAPGQRDGRPHIMSARTSRDVYNELLGGLIVRASDLRSKGRGFDSWGEMSCSVQA